MVKGNDIVVEAKHQYTVQLIDTLSPFIYQGFKTIFNSCKGTPSSLKKFQEKICNVTKWNQEIIDTEYQRIIDTSKCSWIDKLIEVIFIYNVKILTTISDNKKTFNIKIPEVKNFIHKCYIETARNLYIEPYVINDEGANNLKKCMEIISRSIEKTIISLIPQQEIIEKCLSDDPDIDSEKSIEEERYKQESINEESDSGSDIDDEQENEYSQIDQLENLKGLEDIVITENKEPEQQIDQEEKNEEFKDIESASNSIFMKEPEPILEVENLKEDLPVKDDDIPFFSDEE